MGKRPASILVGALVLAGVALSMGQPAVANCAAEGETAGDTLVHVTPNTRIYGAGNGSDSGFVGISGPSGYLEAQGDAGNGTGNIRGTTTGGELNGKLSADLDGNPRLCLNDDEVL